MRARLLSRGLVLAGVAVAVLACGKNTKGPFGGGRTEVKDTFGHACATDDDCTPVFFGNTCGICSDSNGAITKKDRDAYQKALNAAREKCPAERVVGECAVSYGVTQCSPAKTCTYVSCGWHAPKDEHHCPPDGG